MLKRTGSVDMAVSVVVPAYNEGARLPETLPALLAGLARLDTRAEVVLVDDGSTDDTAEVAARHLADLPDVRILQLPWNCGKGAATRAGVSLASGAVIVLLDADLGIDLEDLSRLVSLLDAADVALGSRTVPAPVPNGRPTPRHVAAAVFRGLTQHLTAAPATDSQCGFKAFKAPVAKLLFSMTTSTGFGFDVEVLSLARALGLRVVQCPVHWNPVDAGTLSLRRQGPGLLHNLHRARRHRQRAASAVWEQSIYPGDPWPAGRGAPLMVERAAHLDSATEEA